MILIQRPPDFLEFDLRADQKTTNNYALGD
jgi:hypothetical protein